MARVLRGAPVAKAIDEISVKQVQQLEDAGVHPILALVRVGEKPDDMAYERAAIKRCDKVGVGVKQFCLPAEVSTEQIVELIQNINSESSVHGCLVFLPLPKHINETEIKNAIAVQKDVDGASESSLGGIFAGKADAFLPCTARACVELLDHYGFDVAGKRATVVGRSLVIGKPVAMELIRRNATVTVCHTKTRNLGEEIKRAELVVAAAGKVGVVEESSLSEGQWVVDVGINVMEDGTICGDVSTDIEASHAEAITPVPGGVGNITTAVLARHTIEAAAAQNNIKFVDF